MIWTLFALEVWHKKFTVRSNTHENRKKKVAIIENHELGIYSIRHDLVMAMAEKYEVSVLTEIDDSFKDGDLESAVSVY